MTQLYPLKFSPIFKEKLWGGQKIKTILGKNTGNFSNCGETWELSGVEDNISKVAEGVFSGTSLTQLIDRFEGELVGDTIFEQFGHEFPLLIKFIDAAQDLSIQVHPNDELAKKRHNGRGKTEMWYILQADEGASLISGFNRKISKEEYLDHFHSGRLTELLNREMTRKDDVFFLPPGRVHTIGEGLLLAEIQQTSDITYRIYDFDRVDKDGNKRELHVEEALDAIDFDHCPEYKTHYQVASNEGSPIIQTPFFTTNKWSVDREVHVDRTDLDCFKIYIGTKGSGMIRTAAQPELVPIAMGEVILVPACIKAYTIEPKGSLELLETYIEL